MLKDMRCASKMDHWVKVSAAQPDDLSLVSETHIVEEES